MKILFFAAVALIVTSCTSVTVRPVASSESFQSVCIVNNPQVQVSDFVDVIRDGFSRHNLATTVVDEAQASSCDVTLTYTALRSWDMATYLSHAELRLWRGGKQIGYAEYHLNGRGGLDLAKWQGTKAKMDPVIDQLLAQKTGS